MIRDRSYGVVFCGKDSAGLCRFGRMELAVLFQLLKNVSKCLGFDVSGAEPERLPDESYAGEGGGEICWHDE